MNRLEITPDKQYLAVAGNPHIRLFDIHSTRPDHMGQFDGHTNNVTAVGFQKDRKWMYSSSEDASIKVWDIRVPAAQRDYASKAPVSCVVLHPNQGELISGDEEGVIRVWDLTANQCTMEWAPEGRCAIRSLTVGSDASVLVAVNNRGMAYSWKLNTQHAHTVVAPPPHAASPPSASQPSPKDAIHSTLAHPPSSTPAAANAVKAGGLEPIVKYEAHPSSYVTKCLLSPDVKLLATAASDRSIRIWNCEHGYTCERTLQGHSAWVWDVSFSADSAYLVSGSSDKTAKLWDVKSGEIILEYKGHGKAITAVALNDSS